MGEVVQIRTRADALKLAAGWQAHAQRLECLLLLIQEQKRASDILLEIAEAELLRLNQMRGHDEQHSHGSTPQA